MAEAKAGRPRKRQLGQFMTPRPLAAQLVGELKLSPESRVLEPSFGDGAFLMPVIERFMTLHDGPRSRRLKTVLTKNLWGVELDEGLWTGAVQEIESRYGPLPKNHNLHRGDFFRVEFFSGQFDCIVGNPPYGGTFDPELEDSLDRLYGFWNGHKLKKETYSFFIARCLEWLALEGTLNFITSDTFLTIKTMSGLRRRLMDECDVEVEALQVFSAETSQPTLVLRANKTGPSQSVVVNGWSLPRDLVASTGNFSWRVDESVAHYFAGPTLGDYIVATSGMTVGKNDLFLRRIDGDKIVEPLAFEFFRDHVTLEKELAKARLNKLSSRKQEEIARRESAGDTARNVRATEVAAPINIQLPHPDYSPYNKACSDIVYAPARWVIFWKDDGDAVITFKKNGNWYLHGVGGRGFFKREGLTWQLIASRLNMRYLPAGYILDSGAPCAFLRDNVDANELWFILGWCLTDEATRILKTVINHTRNIQSKDVERLPYPFWVDRAGRAEAEALVVSLVEDARAGRRADRGQPELRKLCEIYAFR